MKLKLKIYYNKTENTVPAKTTLKLSLLLSPMNGCYVASLSTGFEATRTNIRTHSTLKTIPTVRQNALRRISKFS